MVRILVLSLSMIVAATAAKAGVVAEQFVEKEVVVRDADGADGLQRVKAEKVKPGEQVIYSLRFVNDGADAAEGVVLVMPVPEEVNYVEGSIAGADTKVTFSADGGITYVGRGRLTVAENGKQRPARGSEITHIKWSLNGPLQPGEKGEIAYRGILQ